MPTKVLEKIWRWEYIDLSTLLHGVTHETTNVTVSLRANCLSWEPQIILGSSEGNVGMLLVVRSGSIGSMGIPDVSFGGPGSKISGEQLVIDVTTTGLFL